MSYALVGVAGPVNTTGASTNNTPAYGQSSTAGNLLVLTVSGEGSATLPSAPAGWSIGKQVAGTSCSASIFYKVAAGGDAAPTITGIAGNTFNAKLYEFSGNATTSPLDQTGSGAALTTPITATCGGVDAAAGQLLVASSAAAYSAAASKTLSDTFNNGASSTSDTNNATSSANHYCFSFGITTGNGGADSNTHAQTTTSILGGASVLASFKLSVIAIPNVTIPPYLPY